MTTRTTAPDSAADPGPDLESDADVRLRPMRGFDEEIEALWRVSDRARQADGELERNSLEGMASYYRHLVRCDLARDLVVAEIDGQVVGYARVEWNDSNDGERWYEGIGIVDPAVRGRGVGSLLLAWSERRRLEIAADHAGRGDAEGRVRAMTTFVFDGDRGGARLLERAGYVPFRHFATMQRPDLEAIGEVALPAGLEIRPVSRDRAAIRQVFDADVEAFRDHFGWSEGSDERFAEWLENPEMDPELWLVAFDGGEVAGAVLTAIHVGPDGDRSGWLDSIFTRRPWRQRGLARALIGRSLARLREHGMTTASLGVDTANANEALALYESCGFRVVSRATAYRKSLPPASTAGSPTEVP
jgi:ribosomal protein S18 acetylase RimI-like enzyme